VKGSGGDHALGASHDPAGRRGDVDASDGFVVAAEFIDEFELGGFLAVELDVVLAGYCESFAIGGEGVVGDRGVEEVVDFRGGHGGWL